MKKLMYVTVLLICFILIGCQKPPEMTPETLKQTAEIVVTSTPIVMGPGLCQPQTAPHIPSKEWEFAKEELLRQVEKVESPEGTATLFINEGGIYRCLFIKDLWNEVWVVTNEGLSYATSLDLIEDAESIIFDPPLAQKWSDWGRLSLTEWGSVIFETERETTQKDLLADQAYQELKPKIDATLSQLYIDRMESFYSYNAPQSPAEKCWYMYEWSGLITLPEDLANCANQWPFNFPHNDMSTGVDNVNFVQFYAPPSAEAYPALKPGKVFDGIEVLETCIPPMPEDHLTFKDQYQFTVRYNNVLGYEATRSTPNHSWVMWYDTTTETGNKAFYYVDCP